MLNLTLHIGSYGAYANHVPQCQDCTTGFRNVARKFEHWLEMHGARFHYGSYLTNLAGGLNAYVEASALQNGLALLL